MDCHTKRNPIHWSSFTGDQDNASAAAVEDARKAVGETRPTNWQYCQFHALKASNRKFARDSSSKPQSNVVCDQDGLFPCPGCSRKFKSKAAVGTHRRYCSSKDSSSAPSNDRSLEPLVKLNDLNSKEAKVYKRKIAHWLLLRKNRELRNGTRSIKSYKTNPGQNDQNLKQRLKQAASSIVHCLENDHTLCRQFSFVCQNGCDPYAYLLPHGRPIVPLPPSVKGFVADSVNEIFLTSKLDRLIFRSGLGTTSHVESVHRTIRQACPKVDISCIFFVTVGKLVLVNRSVGWLVSID